MNTIRDGWITYRDRVIPPQAGEYQRLESKRAFYAGAAHLFSLVTSEEITSKQEDEAVQSVQNIVEELQAFKEAGFK